MNENSLSFASTRCAIEALDEAKRSSSLDERRFYLNQAAVYAHLAEIARREGDEE